MSDRLPPLGTVTKLGADLRDYCRREAEDEDARREAAEEWRWRMWEFMPAGQRWPR